MHAYGRGAVAKVPDPSTPSAWIVYEARYTEAARDAGAPVPRLLGIEQIGDRVASVWERVRGPSMWQAAIDRPDRSAELGRLLADSHYALFDLVPPVTLPAQRDRLVSKIRRAAGTVDASLSRAIELLPAPLRTLRLCHGDLHPSNVILAPGGPVIVDWFDASRGDPVADVARSSLLLDGAHTPRHLPGAGAETLTVLTDAYLARLRERLDIGREQLTLWQAINAVARLAEGMPRAPLLDVWNRFASAEGIAPGAQAAAG